MPQAVRLRLSYPRRCGRTVEVRLYPTYVEMRDEGRPIARHECCYQDNQQVLDLEHYLDSLERKPGALIRRNRSRRGAHAGYAWRVTIDCSKR